MLRFQSLSFKECIHSLPLLLSAFRTGVLVLLRDPSKGQKELLTIFLWANKWMMLNRKTWILYALHKVVGDLSRGWPEGFLFNSYYIKVSARALFLFPGLLHFTLDPYLIILSVKQGGIKYHFLSLWYDSTWDWTQVSCAIGELSIMPMSGTVMRYIVILKTI